MPSLPSPTSRRLATLAFALFAIAGFALFEPEAAPLEDESVVFAMSLEAPDGSILASPVVVGSPGRKLEVRLMCEKDPRLERMSVVLEPVSDADGEWRYSYELSIAGRFTGERGTVDLVPGREKRTQVKSGDPRGVTFALYAAPLKHHGLEQYLKARRLRLARAAS